MQICFCFAFTMIRFQPFHAAEIFHCILNVSYVHSLRGFWNLVKSRYVKLECKLKPHYLLLLIHNLHFVFFDLFFEFAVTTLATVKSKCIFFLQLLVLSLSLFHLKFDRHEDFTTVFHDYCHKVKWKKSSLER